MASYLCKQRRHLAHVGLDARDVRSRGERTDPHPILVFRILQQLLQVLEIDMTMAIQLNLYRFCQALAPRNFVGMMLVRPDEDDRLMFAHGSVE